MTLKQLITTNALAAGIGLAVMGAAPTGTIG